MQHQISKCWMNVCRLISVGKDFHIKAKIRVMPAELYWKLPIQMDKSTRWHSNHRREWSHLESRRYGGFPVWGELHHPRTALYHASHVGCVSQRPLWWGINFIGIYSYSSPYVATWWNRLTSMWINCNTKPHMLESQKSGQLIYSLSDIYSGLPYKWTRLPDSLGSYWVQQIFHQDTSRIIIIILLVYFTIKNDHMFNRIHRFPSHEPRNIYIDLILQMWHLHDDPTVWLASWSNSFVNSYSCGNINWECLEKNLTVRSCT